MADKREQYFPIESVSSLCDYLKFEAEQDNPSLALVSIILGFFETTLSARKPPIDKLSEHDSPDTSASTKVEFPSLDYVSAKQMLDEFTVDTFKREEIRDVISKKPPATREVVKTITEAIWNALSQKYSREKPHIQFLYSFVKSSQLDSYGVACAVVLACQHFGFYDVHLCLSEDHAWISFGDSADRQNAEVTWHCKSGEERLGSEISESQMKDSWVYLDGQNVNFDSENSEFALLIHSINPVIDSGIDCFELVSVQKKLLSFLHGKQLLKKFPLALSNLANLMEMMNSSVIESAKVFQEAISNVRRFYSNRHVCPYIYYGGFLLRNCCLLGAVWCWAEAAFVLSDYCYHRDDEEIYKDMYEFAVDMLPGLLKANTDEAHNILKQPLGFALLLKLYDGLCAWEAGSQTPVVHITWSKAISVCISKFNVKIRKSVSIFYDSDNEKEEKLDRSLIPDNISALENDALKFLSETTSFCLQVKGKLGIEFQSDKMNEAKDFFFADRIKHDAIHLLLTAHTSSQKGSSRYTANGSVNSDSSNQPRASKRLRSK